VLFTLLFSVYQHQKLNRFLLLEVIKCKISNNKLMNVKVGFWWSFIHFIIFTLSCSAELVEVFRFITIKSSVAFSY